MNNLILFLIIFGIIFLISIITTIVIVKKEHPKHDIYDTIIEKWGNK